MRRRHFIRGLGAATLATPALAGPAVQWTAFTPHPPGSASMRAFARLAEQLAAATDGRLTLRPQPLGTVAVNVANLTGAVAAGVVELAEDPFYSLAVPAAGMLRLPMLVNSASDYRTAADALQPFLRSALAGREVVFLGAARQAAQSLWARAGLVRLDDLYGRRVRLTAPEQGELVRRYNGVPVTLAATEIPEALAARRIDAAFATAATASGQPPEAWKSAMTAGYTGYQGYADNAFIANPRAWDRLGPELRRVLGDCLEDVTAWLVATRDAEEAAGREALRKAGATVTYGTPADTAAAAAKLASYWNDWAVPRGRAAVEQMVVVRQALGR